VRTHRGKQQTNNNQNTWHAKRIILDTKVYVGCSGFGFANAARVHRRVDCASAQLLAAELGSTQSATTHRNSKLDLPTPESPISSSCDTEFARVVVDSGERAWSEERAFVEAWTKHLFESVWPQRET
jgi:hypothetical protein